MSPGGLPPAKGQLHVLAGSHFCELALRTLQQRGVPLQVVALSPGPHVLRLRRQWPGLRCSQLPVWPTGQALLQGSDQILNHLGQCPVPDIAGIGLSYRCAIFGPAMPP